MKVRKIIATTIDEYLNKQEKIFEYISKNMIYLKDYLSMSDEQKKEYLPDEYYHFIQDFFDETDVDHSYDGNPYEKRLEFDDDIEFVEWLRTNNKELYNDFANYLFKKIKNNTLPIDDSEYPAWSYFDNNPQLIKNQWLIHFTNDADSIAKSGFKYGVDDMTKLGLTTHLGEFDKKYGGYNFAYTLNDFQKYGSSSYGNWSKSGYKYGNEAVIFNASGIKVWHYGDEEPQVIFYGNTAKNIIPITSGDNFKFAIYGKNGKILYENDKLTKVVDWIVNNYQQYRKNFAY